MSRVKSSLYYILAVALSFALQRSQRAKVRAFESRVSEPREKLGPFEMKLIVTGATGLVGSEVIRLALCNPAITSVVAIARKPVLAPANDVGTESQTSKLQSVILESWTSPYPESVIRHVKDADACIW